DAIALCLTSLDFAKQERVLEELERSSWDLTIVDEAHHCIGAGASSDRDDTQRRRLAEVVAARSDGLLLLTATPHDGYDPHFASLIELLDPSLEDGRGGLLGHAYRRHVVRRLKSHLRDPATGAPLFHERRVIPVKVDLSGTEMLPVRQFHAALAALIAPRLRRATPVRDAADALAFVSLLKRSVSTIRACIATLRVVADRYRAAGKTDAEPMGRERRQALRAYRRRLLRFGVLDHGDESELAELEADGMAADLRRSAATELLRATKTSAMVEALDALIALGEAATAHDPKLDAVTQEIRTIRADHPGANILVYTEFADSQAALRRALEHGIEGVVLSINGGDSEAERTRIAERCAEQDGIVLISTDSLAEGLNLQQRCWNLIHLDLPYNPNRLEQRNGRIDRYGQTRDPQIRYLYLAGTFEERLLLHLIRKYEQARAHLTFMPETLGVTADSDGLGAGLIAGFAERQAGLFDDEPTAIRTIDREAESANAEAYKDLLREIDQAFVGFDRSAVRYGWLGDPAFTDSVGVPSGRDQDRVSVDLPDFVAEAIEAETAHRAGGRGLLRVPADWQNGLDDLPGFDRTSGTFRFTRDRAKLRDRNGRSLGVLGRAHPLVRRAISCMHRVGGETCDSRVGIARGAEGEPPAVLFTFSIELRSAIRIELRRAIAVLLRESGDVSELEAPEHWLCYAEPVRAVTMTDAWNRLFAHWVPQRQSDVSSVAKAAMRRETARVTGELGKRAEREASGLKDWLRRRADGICGAYEPAVGDLFGAVPLGPDWRFVSAPLERLAMYGADAGNALERRRQADTVVELFQRRCAELAAYTDLSEPVLHPTGMLMLAPASPA
ncbi:MAG TPA: helicase-related protein, partial [Acetobacteraceae bacterium]